MIKLIIQIPCFNESGTLSLVLNDLPTALEGVDCIETLVIDDGSHDGTSKTAKQLGVNHVVSHRANRGLAAAFATGLEESLSQGATVIVNTDRDHQYPSRYIKELVRPILLGLEDFVIGNRSPENDRLNHRTTLLARKN